MVVARKKLNCERINDLVGGAYCIQPGEEKCADARPGFFDPAVNTKAIAKRVKAGISNARLGGA